MEVYLSIGQIIFWTMVMIGVVIGLCVAYLMYDIVTGFRAWRKKNKEVR